MKSFIVFVVDSWRGIMDVRYNPLRFIPDPVLQSYFMMALATLWSASFGIIGVYYLGWMGSDILTSILVHLSLLVPITFTNAVFVDAERDGEKWVQQWRRITSSDRKKNKVEWDLENEG